MLRHPLGRAAALSAALAVGDLGVIALFGTPETATLPLLLYQRLAAYQFDAAAVMALVLLGLCLAMFVVSGAGDRRSCARLKSNSSASATRTCRWSSTCM